MEPNTVKVYDRLFGSYMGEMYISDKSVSLTSEGRKDTLYIHSKEKCAGRFCTFHNSSEHHMRDWPMNVRLDKSALVERVCPCGVGHPDPDSVAFLGRTDKYIGVHGCDGCCSPRERFEI
jgi:hypothetical protein